MSAIQKVGVMGCGLMGRGIAQIAAQSGHDTVVREIKDEFNEKGRAAIVKSLDKFVEKGKLSAEDREATLGRFRDCFGCRQRWLTLDDPAPLDPWHDRPWERAEVLASMSP